MLGTSLVCIEAAGKQIIPCQTLFNKHLLKPQQDLLEPYPTDHILLGLFESE